VAPSLHTAGSAAPPRLQPLLIFSHGNSFPAGTYGVVFRHLRARGYTVRAIDKFGHDSAYPVTSNWPQLVRQLADFAALQVEQTGQPACLVGHSLGGYLSLMCAAQHPTLGGQPLAGVVLLDSPLVGGWRATAVGLAKNSRVVGSVAPGAISRRRRNQWLDKQEVLDYFLGKKAFAAWNEEVLRDYIEHGTHDASGPDSKQLLSFDRDVETAIYNTLPHNLEQLLRRHPLQCPVSFIGGLQSAEIRQAGMALTNKVTRGRITMLDGSHLFPMERPAATAAAIETALLNMSAGQPLADQPERQAKTFNL
jgi:pimeloyl-ACP methyl ester carboxylesterase